LVFGDDFFELRFDAISILRVGKLNEFLDLLVEPLTKESIIEKTHLTDSHPPPNLPLEGGGN